MAVPRVGISRTHSAVRDPCPLARPRLCQDHRRLELLLAITCRRRTSPPWVFTLPKTKNAVFMNRPRAKAVPGF